VRTVALVTLGRAAALAALNSFPARRTTTAAPPKIAEPAVGTLKFHAP